jgi:predicted transcriptional regulator
MDYTSAFLEMASAYKSELGDAFPSADPRSVLFVLRECNKLEPTSQRQIEQLTHISQPNVAKLVAKMIERGWLEASKRDPKTGVKALSVSYEGSLVLRRFEDACKLEVKRVRKVKDSASIVDSSAGARRRPDRE